MELLYKIESFISEKIGYKYIDGKIYSRSYFIKLSENIFSEAIRPEYERLIRLYPTKEDVRKGYENLILFFEMVHRLNLQKSSPKRILDLGSRGGVFPFVCNSYGHSATATDLGEVLSKSPNPELLKLFGVEHMPLRVEPLQPLPEVTHQFDLITGFRTRFHSRYTWETGKELEVHWGIEEWDFFLTYLANNYTSENGRIFFMVNRLQEREKGQVIPDDLRNYFLSKGATIRYSFLSFENLSLFR